MAPGNSMWDILEVSSNLSHLLEIRVLSLHAHAPTGDQRSNAGEGKKVFRLLVSYSF